MATPASAATIGTLPASPTATIIAADRSDGVGTAATTAAALASYAFKVTGTVTNLRATVTGTAGTVQVQQQATNGAPTDTGTWTNVTVGAASVVVDATPVATDVYYIGSQSAGSYTLSLFEDLNGNTTYDSGVDNVVPDIPVVVKDIGQTGSTTAGTTADDLSMTVSAPSSVTLGNTITATATTGGLSTADSRGSTVLAGAVAAVVPVTFAGVAGVAGGNGTATFSTTTNLFSRTSGAAGAVGDVTTTYSTVPVIAGTKTYTASTSVTSNSVASLTVTDLNTDTANIDYNGASTKVRPGTTTVPYKVKALNGSSVPVAGAVVTFTFSGPAGDIAYADITANGAALDSSNQATATTNSDGIATLSIAVGSGDTTNGSAYTVTPSTNGVTGAVLTATYATAVVTTVTASNASAVVGGTATLTGTVVDQWKQPIATAGVPAVLAITGSATGSGSYPVSSTGTFSATATDVVGNTTPRTDTFTWTVGGVGSGAKTLRWATSVTPSTITLNAVGAVTAFPVASTSTFPVAVDTASNRQLVTATVKDSTGATVPFTSFTIDGTDGIYFLDSSNNAVETFTARTNATGQISHNETFNGVYAVFTDAGADAEIRVTSGAAPPADSGEFTVNAPANTEDYIVEADDVAGEPGEFITVTGQVTDIFGNGVPTVPVSLTIDTTGAGSFLTTPPVNTDANGAWSIVFVSGGNFSGEVDYRATINGGVTNPTGGSYVVAGEVAGGITLPNGFNTAFGEIDVFPDVPLTVNVPTRLVGSGNITVKGTAQPTSTVTIFGTPTGSGQSYKVLRTTTADTDGDYKVVISITKSMTIKSRTTQGDSGLDRVKVYSDPKLSLKAMSRNRVKLSVNGDPNAKVTAKFYRILKGKADPKVGSVKTDKYGRGSIVIRTSDGRKSYKVTYDAPYTVSGTATGAVTVK